MNVHEPNPMLFSAKPNQITLDSRIRNGISGTGACVSIESFACVNGWKQTHKMELYRFPSDYAEFVISLLFFTDILFRFGPIPWRAYLEQMWSDMGQAFQ